VQQRLPNVSSGTVDERNRSSALSAEPSAEPRCKFKAGRTAADYEHAMKRSIIRRPRLLDFLAGRRRDRSWCFGWRVSCDSFEHGHSLNLLIQLDLCHSRVSAPRTEIPSQYEFDKCQGTAGLKPRKEVPSAQEQLDKSKM
jgi:hypothetical protein